MHELRDLFERQSGTAARRQLLSAGLDDNDLQRMVRRRELVRVHTGVYVNHTGPLSWSSRAWAAVLFHDEAALCDASALNLAGHPIHVAIEWPRKGTPLPGIRLHRLRHLGPRVQWNLSPPRLRVEDAALDVAAAASTFDGAVAVLASVCQRRRTTPDRLLQALDRRPRLRRGVELRGVVLDVASGMHSVLERTYALRVERRHGLPRGTRQHQESAGARAVYRDVIYRPYGVVVELDGYAWHSDVLDRAADMSRDLHAVASGLVTVRLGWPQVHDDACATALSLTHVLRRRGWTGVPRPCSPTCALRGASHVRGA